MSEHDEFMPIDSENIKSRQTSILYDEITSNITGFKESVTREPIVNTIVENVVVVDEVVEKVADIVEEVVVEEVVDVVDEVKEVVDVVDEVVVDEVVVNEVEKVVESLANTLNVIIIQKIGLDKYNIQITPEIRKVFKKLLVDHTFFDEVEQNLKNIVQDGKIDSNDVPQIILLITNLYKQIHKLKIKFNEKLCGDILKIIFVIAIKENIINVQNNDLDLLKCVYNIIDTSISLMLIKKELTHKGLLNCILSIFLPKNK